MVPKDSLKPLSSPPPQLMAGKCHAPGAPALTLLSSLGHLFLKGTEKRIYSDVHLMKKLCISESLKKSYDSQGMSILCLNLSCHVMMVASGCIRVFEYLCHLGQDGNLGDL